MNQNNHSERESLLVTPLMKTSPSPVRSYSPKPTRTYSSNEDRTIAIIFGTLGAIVGAVPGFMLSDQLGADHIQQAAMIIGEMAAGGFVGYNMIHSIMALNRSYRA